MTHCKSVEEYRPKIILAEDDTGVRRSLQFLLLGEKFDVRSYASSADVLADRSNRDAICLVTDYRMPGVDGIDLLLSLRRFGWAGRSVLITAYQSPELKDQALLAGFEVVLDKPLRPQNFIDVISRLSVPGSQRP